MGSKKPTVEEVAKFRDNLAEEIQKSKMLVLQQRSKSTADYEIQVSILSYSRGSGATRLLLGHFGMGKAECIVRLKLVDNGKGATVFAGNFRAIVDHGFISGNKVFKRVSEDFCGRLEKRLKTLQEGSEKTPTS